MAKTAGELVFSGPNELMTAKVKGSTTITIGRGCTFDANGYLTTETGSGSKDTGLFIALETVVNSGSDGDKSCQIAIGNTYVYGVALDNTIKPENLLKFSTGGKLTPNAKPALSAVTNSASIVTAINAARDYYGKAAARYIMMEGEEKGATNPITDSVIGVRLGAD